VTVEDSCGFAAGQEPGAKVAEMSNDVVGHGLLILRNQRVPKFASTIFSVAFSAGRRFKAGVGGRPLALVGAQHRFSSLKLKGIPVAIGFLKWRGFVSHSLRQFRSDTAKRESGHGYTLKQATPCRGHYSSVRSLSNKPFSGL
jgi:hypothetical protein